MQVEEFEQDRSDRDVIRICTKVNRQDSESTEQSTRRELNCQYYKDEALVK